MNGSVRNSTLLKRLVFSGVIDLQVDGARHFLLTSAHEKEQAIPCIVIFLYLPLFLATNVALMVWSNHDENKLDRGNLKGLVTSTAIGL